MCSPADIIFSTINLGTSVLSKVEETKNAQYKKQIAANNAKNAKNNAMNIEQTGIEQARNEKIKGLRILSDQKAKNASSGFDLNSSTMMYQYQDIMDNTQSSIETIKSDYNSKAQSYYDKMNSYNSTINSIESTEKLNNYAMLGSTSLVAKKWFNKKNEGVQDGNIKSTNF